MGYFDTDFIWNVTKSDLICDIICKFGITKRTLAELVAVAPYLRVFVDAVKNEGDFLTAVFFRQHKSPPVPSDAAGKVTGTAGIFC